MTLLNIVNRSQLFRVLSSKFSIFLPLTIYSIMDDGVRLQVCVAALKLELEKAFLFNVVCFESNSPRTGKTSMN